MLTLQELKRITDMPENQGKLPTARHLRKSGTVIVRGQFGRETEIAVYQNGCVLYQAGKYSTVFSLQSCGDYFYISEGNAVHLPEQFFDKERWYLRLVLEGEDRLNRNCEERERRWKVSYSAISEDWSAMENLTESALEQLAKQEIVEEILEGLTERQRYIIQKYYLQEETQEQISNELGISQQAVSLTISQSISSIRKNYPAFQKLPEHRICYKEGRV